MSSQNLQGKRALITHADVFMGPVLCEVFRQQGATVIADTDALRDPAAPAAIIAAAQPLDILVANLAIPAPSTPVVEASEEEWRSTFAALVDPLPRLFQAALPDMIQRRAGKILVMGSASALRGIKRASTCSAARNWPMCKRLG